MVLSGDGGDESFAGYHGYCGWMSAVSGAHRPLWKRLLRPLVSRLMPRRYPAFRPRLEHWFPFITYLPPHEQETLWRREHRAVCDTPLDVFEREFARTEGYALCSIPQYLDLKTYLPFAILTKVDVASMMHGLEVRTPLVDVRVMEFAATIPAGLSMGRNPDGAWQGKRLLRRLMRRKFPAEFLDRRKMGFSMPVARWLGPGGAKETDLYERLLSRESMLHDWFQPAAILRLIAQENFGPVWLLLVLDEWLRQNRAPAAAPRSAGAAA
jgi:asparagine synthase (glutamine-hydrolysing)